MKTANKISAIRAQRHLEQLAYLTRITLGQLATIPAPPLPIERELEEAEFYLSPFNDRLHFTNKPKSSWVPMG